MYSKNCILVVNFLPQDVSLLLHKNDNSRGRFYSSNCVGSLFGQKEGINGAINTVMDFVREQHKTILQYGRDMMKTTSDWGNRFYNQVSAYNQRDLDQLVEKNKEIRSLHEKVADTQKIVHELDKHQEVQ